MVDTISKQIGCTSSKPLDEIVNQNNKRERNNKNANIILIGKRTFVPRRCVVERIC